MSTHDVETHGNANEPHVVPIPIYLAVFAALLLGTYLTVWAAGQDFGAFNTVVALGIAVTKATLVILFFMHVKYSPRLTQLVVATAVFAAPKSCPAAHTVSAVPSMSAPKTRK